MLCDKCQQLVNEQLERQKQQLQITEQQLLFLRGTIAVLEALYVTSKDNADDTSVNDI